jgi:hypothetical protein
MSGLNSDIGCGDRRIVHLCGPPLQVLRLWRRPHLTKSIQVLHLPRNRGSRPDEVSELSSLRFSTGPPAPATYSAIIGITSIDASSKEVQSPPLASLSRVICPVLLFFGIMDRVCNFHQFLDKFPSLESPFLNSNHLGHIASLLICDCFQIADANTDIINNLQSDSSFESS